MEDPPTDLKSPFVFATIFLGSLVLAMLICIVVLTTLHWWRTGKMRRRLILQAHLSTIYEEHEAKRKEDEAAAKVEAKRIKKEEKAKAALMRW